MCGTHTVLLTSFRDLQEDGSREVFERVFQGIDVDDSRRIDYSHFAQYLRNYHERPGHRRGSTLFNPGWKEAQAAASAAAGGGGGGSAGGGAGGSAGGGAAVTPTPGAPNPATAADEEEAEVPIQHEREQAYDLNPRPLMVGMGEKYEEAGLVLHASGGAEVEGPSRGVP